MDWVMILIALAVVAVFTFIPPSKDESVAEQKSRSGPIKRVLEILFDAIGFLSVRIYTVVCKVLSWAWQTIKTVSAFVAKAVSLVIYTIIILADRAMELLVDKLLWPIFSKLVPDKYKLRTLCIGFIGLLVAFALTVDYMASEAKANDLIKADTTSDGGDK